MMEFIKNITIRKFWQLKVLRNWEGSYLDKTGWINSFKNKKPISNTGEPLPWLSYGAIKFLEKRLQKSMNMFEYGSGQSSIYFGRRIHKVYSVESDQAWKQHVETIAGDNNLVVYKDVTNEPESYIKSISEFTLTFDLILIDGRERNACLKFGLNFLSESGVIIFDDFDREKYRISEDVIKDRGFKKIDFWGMAPGSLRLKNTAIFYKTDNCLFI